MSTVLPVPIHSLIEVVSAAHETWPLSQPFVISRGAKTAADIVCVTISDGTFEGRGECVPYARYGESVESVLAIVRGFGRRHAFDRETLRLEMPAGAARNCLDCALWDLEAKRARGQAQTQHCSGDVAVGGPLSAVETAVTLSLGTPDDMAAQAKQLRRNNLFKLKLGGSADGARIKAVREARGDARLLLDANEAWDDSNTAELLEIAIAAGVEVVEQPLPAGADGFLQKCLLKFGGRIAICADESVHTRGDFSALADRYNAVNIKLDKAGGLTEALDCLAAAKSVGLRVMVGSMVGTSLSMAPAMVLAQSADWADLDSPLLLARDRPHGLAVADGYVSPPTPALWG